jgi:hypothetical protein
VDIAGKQTVTLIQNQKKLKMRQYLLRNTCRLGMTLLMMYGGWAMGQAVVTVNGTTVTDLNAAPLNDPALKAPITGIVSPVIVPNGKSSGNASGLCNIWLEYSDGGFTTNAVTHPQLRVQSASPYLFFVPLYDTSKGKDGSITRMMAANTITTDPPSTNQSANYPGLLAADQRIKLTANNYFFVPGEPKILAITHKNLPAGVTANQLATGLKKPQYFAVLYYNSGNKSPFATVNVAGNMTARYSQGGVSNTIGQVRCFNGDAPEIEEVAGIPAVAGYANKVIVRLAPFNDRDSLGMERNIFVTLNGIKKNVPIGVGESTTILVKLFAINGGQAQELGSDSIQSEYRADSFDPNAIEQSPKCMLLPKGGQTLQYTVFFENLGQGPANIIKVAFHRPVGLENAALNLQAVNFAGRSINISGPDFSHQQVMVDGKKIDTFTISANTEDIKLMLMGTGQAGTSPQKRMGHIKFTLAVSGGVQDEVTSYANILFHSFWGDWEAPVKTNMGKTVFKQKDCECNDTCLDGKCHLLFGLCWWWWVLILLGLLLLLWLLRRRR